MNSGSLKKAFELHFDVKVVGVRNYVARPERLIRLELFVINMMQL